MATSSILTELVIEDPKKAEAFINALEMSSQEPVCSPSAPSIPILDICILRWPSNMARQDRG